MNVQNDCIRAQVPEPTGPRMDFCTRPATNWTPWATYVPPVNSAASTEAEEERVSAAPASVSATNAGSGLATSAGGAWVGAAVTLRVNATAGRELAACGEEVCAPEAVGSRSDV